MKNQIKKDLQIKGFFSQQHRDSDKLYNSIENNSRSLLPENNNQIIVDHQIDDKDLELSLMINLYDKNKPGIFQPKMQIKQKIKFKKQESYKDFSQEQYEQGIDMDENKCYGS